MKKIKYVFFFMLNILLATPVLAKDITCSKIKIDGKIPDTVALVILFLQVAVPVLLVIFGSMDLIKAVVAGKEDEIKKAQGTFVKRLIAGALVFFVVVIVKLIFNFATYGDEDTGVWKCAECFIRGTSKCTK